LYALHSAGGMHEPSCDIGHPSMISWLGGNAADMAQQFLFQSCADVQWGAP
jgi:hypothetical protein